MSEVTYWRIWYDDGNTFDSTQGRPEDAPSDGVLAVEEHRADGRGQIYRGPEYYFWTGDSWAAGNIADLERWLRREMPRLKYGRWTTEAIWQGLLEKLKARR